MAESTSFKWYLFNFVMLGIFLIALVNFGLGLFAAYGIDSKVVDEERINITGIQSTTLNINEDSQSLTEAFTKDQISFASGVLALSSLFGIMVNMMIMMGQLMVLYFAFFQSVLGIPYIVTGFITAGILLSAAFAAWKVLTAGE